MPAAPGFELHLADSELLAPRWDAGSLVLPFAAAVVRPVEPAAGDDLATGPGPGHGLGTSHGLGHIRGLSLRLAGARVTGDLGAAFGRLADGRWQPAGQAPRRTMRVPTAIDQAVRLSLALANGTLLDIEAAALQAVVSGAPDYRDSLAC
jgi:hypothetical protein